MHSRQVGDPINDIMMSEPSKTVGKMG